MKHPVSRLILLILLFAPTLCRAEVITEDSARVIAQRVARSWALRQSPASACSLRTWVRRNRGRAAQQAPPYYLFEGAEGRGFVVVAGDDVATPVLAFSPDCPLSPEGTLPDGMQAWLDDLAGEIVAARQAGILSGGDTKGNDAQGDDAMRIQGAEPSVGNVVRQLDVPAWAQGEPYNSECPAVGQTHCATGCVPTVYAELMRFYEYPAKGIGTTAAYSVSEDISVAARTLEHTYDWSLMPTSFDEAATAEGAAAVATLMADIGAALQAKYGTEETAASLGRDALFYHFNYFPGTREQKASFTAVQWYAKLHEAIDAGHPVPYRADNAAGGGHAFIVDGYTDRNYFHVNWGWGGHYNGYFALGALQPGSVDYTSGQMAYFNCVPMPLRPEPNEARIGEREYPSLKLAFGSVEALGTTEDEATEITLLADILSDRITIAEGQHILLDLNGHLVSTTASIINNGALTIVAEDEGSGIVNVQGNHSILSNYGTMTVRGGTYTNTVDAPAEGSDYRRAVFAAAGSQTAIIGGTYVSDASTQTFCFNGDATVQGTVFTNGGTGLACLAHSGAEVVLEDVSASASRLFNTGGEASLRCRSGLFSLAVDARFLDAESECVANTDPATMSLYPYRVQVVGTTPIPDHITLPAFASPSSFSAPARIYNILGQPQPHGHGLRVLRRADGSVQKTYKPRQ